MHKPIFQKKKTIFERFRRKVGEWLENATQCKFIGVFRWHRWFGVDEGIFMTRQRVDSERFAGNEAMLFCTKYVCVYTGFS